MRKINNTPTLKEKVREFNRNIFDGRRSDFIKPAVKLAYLKAEVDPLAKYKLDPVQFVAYLGKIETEYEKILSADNRVIKRLIREFEAIIPAENITKEFHEAVVAAMRYDDLREKEFPELLRGLDIKTCVYCHSQSTLVVERLSDKSLKGLLQLDHKYAKSKYPFLCTSFYNLYPICGNCNLSKSDKESAFELYSEGGNLDILTFGLDDKSILKYWKTKKQADLSIIVTPTKDNSGLVRAFNEMFWISEIYDMQRDIAEELVHKKLVYNNEYQKTLVESFKALFPDQSMINRLIIGNYDKPDEMLKRPMAKFIQEIAKDIDLIPKIPERKD